MALGISDLTAYEQDVREDADILVRRNSASAMWYGMSKQQRAIVAKLDRNNLWSYRGTVLYVMEPDGRVRAYDHIGRERPNVWIPRREYPTGIEAGAPGA